MSPFRSKAQMKAAFAGGLGPEMQQKAKEFAKSTAAEVPGGIAGLPEHVSEHASSSYQRANNSIRPSKPPVVRLPTATARVAPYRKPK